MPSFMAEGGFIHRGIWPRNAASSMGVVGRAGWVGCPRGLRAGRREVARGGTPPTPRVSTSGDGRVASGHAPGYGGDVRLAGVEVFGDALVVGGQVLEVDVGEAEDVHVGVGLADLRAPEADVLH